MKCSETWHGHRCQRDEGHTGDHETRSANEDTTHTVVRVKWNREEPKQFVRVCARCQRAIGPSPETDCRVMYCLGCFSAMPRIPLDAP